MAQALVTIEHVCVLTKNLRILCWYTNAESWLSGLRWEWTGSGQAASPQLQTLQLNWQSHPVRSFLHFKERSSCLLALPGDRVVDGSSLFLTVCQAAPSMAGRLDEVARVEGLLASPSLLIIRQRIEPLLTPFSVGMQLRRTHDGIECTISQEPRRWSIAIKFLENGEPARAIVGLYQPTLDMAKSSTDDAVLSSGHTCNGSCGRWEIVST
jgi:hypothetical protein